MDAFPSLKCQQMLRVLRRPPLRYKEKPGKKRTGSHRHLVSAAGYPDIAFWCHDKHTLRGSVVKAILVDQVGLTETKARKLVRKGVMRTIRVTYRKESDGAWIGTSPEVPGFVGHGETYEEARDRVNDGLGWFAEEDLMIAHVLPVLGQLAQAEGTRSPRLSFAMTRAPQPPSVYRHDFESSPTEGVSGVG